jgi:hypothetical protein
MKPTFKDRLKSNYKRAKGSLSSLQKRALSKAQDASAARP